MERRPRARTAAGLAGCLAAVLYTHNIGAFFVAALLAVSLARSLLSRADRRAARAWWAVAGAVSLAYLPWLAVALRQAGQADVVFGWARAGWVDRFPWQLLLSAGALSHGSLAPVRNEVREITAAGWIALALEAVLLAAGLLRGGWRQPGAARALPAVAFLSLLGIFLYSLIATPIYVVGRVDVIALPLLLTAVGGGLAALPRRTAAALAVLLALLAARPLLIAVGTDFKSQERGIASFLAESVEPGGTLVVTGPFLTAQQYYLGRWRPDVSLRVFPPGRAEHPGWVDWEAYPPERLAREAEDLASGLAGPGGVETAGGDVWLLLHPGRGSRAIEEALARSLVERARFGTGYLGIQIIRFAPPP